MNIAQDEEPTEKLAAGKDIRAERWARGQDGVYALLGEGGA